MACGCRMHGVATACTNLVVEGLRSEPLQRFFSVSASIDRSLSFELQQLAVEMVRSACTPDARSGLPSTASVEVP